MTYVIGFVIVFFVMVFTLGSSSREMAPWEIEEEVERNHKDLYND